MDSRNYRVYRNNTLLQVESVHCSRPICKLSVACTDKELRATHDVTYTAACEVSTSNLRGMGPGNLTYLPRIIFVYFFFDVFKKCLGLLETMFQ